MTKDSKKGVVNIEHIGIAVKDLEASINNYESLLGLKVKDVENVEIENVSYQVAFIPVDPTNIELVKTSSTSDSVATFLKEHGEGVHHIAFEVDNIEAMVKTLTLNGADFAWDSIREGSRGTRVALIKPDKFNGLYIELVQKAATSR